MVQVMLSFWSLFIEFLGSYSRWRVTNGLVPRVLGPTNFYLKFWANWNTSECCCVIENTSEFCCVHHDLHLGSYEWTTYLFLGFNIWISHDFLGCTMKIVLSTYFRMFLDQIFFEICLGTITRLIKWNCHFKYMLWGIWFALYNTNSLMCRILVESNLILLLDLLFTFQPLYCSC